jgi:hypothetical protein
LRQGAVVSASYDVRDDNESIRLIVTCTAAEADLDPSTDGSSDGTDPVELTVSVSRDSDGRAHTTLSVAALGLELADLLAGRQPRMIPFRASHAQLRAALNRVAPAWHGWSWDAEIQLASEAEAAGEEWDDEQAWLDALDERSANVFGLQS